jgi:hypothetical protein
MKRDIQVGDIIIPKGRHPYARRITEVRDTGYSWQYVETSVDDDFVSENSSDPFFENGWTLYRVVID